MWCSQALSLTHNVNNWLASSSQPRILHVFDRACNLINERKEVLSLVTSQIGDGPFNLVIEDNIRFAQTLDLQSQISVSVNQLYLGNLFLNTNNSILWNPRPDWQRLHAGRDQIANQLFHLQRMSSATSVLPTSLAMLAWNVSSRGFAPKLPSMASQSLISSLHSSDLEAANTAAQNLAGLGAGLTPAGDDFLMGAMYAAWIIHPPETASVLVQEIANTAAPLTTSLSAAWLRAAGRGEAGILWHEFLNALISEDQVRVLESVESILAVGETSGSDVLAGFFSTMLA